MGSVVRVTVVADTRGAVQQFQRASHHHYQEGKILAYVAHDTVLLGRKCAR
jgi:hypothetical protein